MSLSAQAMAALVDSGVAAYRNRDFKNAIASLQQVLDSDPRHWRAKLYLAMCYYHSGEIFTAYRHFSYLKENCTDAEVRGKAESAIAAMGSQIQTSAKMPEMTCTFNKEQIKVKSNVQVEDDAEEVEWVKQET